MPFANAVHTNDVAATLRDEYSPEIAKQLVTKANTLAFMHKLPDVKTKKLVIPAMSGAITADFVESGTTDLGENIPTSTAAWEGVNLYMEKIGVIVPINKDSIEDSDYDLGAELVPAIAEAFAVKIDAAVIHGTAKPTNWPDGLYTTALAASNVVSLAAFDDLYDAVLGLTGLFSKMEAEGYLVNGSIAAPTMAAKIRACRDSMGIPIFNRTPGQGTGYEFDGQRIVFDMLAAIASANSGLMISGDWTKARWAMRKDMEFEILKEATLTNVAGDTTLNLAQKDMIGLKCVMRLGWNLPNPINRVQVTKGSRCAFGILTA